jgi:hypothetical protein
MNFKKQVQSILNEAKIMNVPTLNSKSYSKNKYLIHDADVNDVVRGFRSIRDDLMDYGVNSNDISAFLYTLVDKIIKDL